MARGHCTNVPRELSRREKYLWVFSPGDQELAGRQLLLRPKKLGNVSAVAGHG